MQERARKRHDARMFVKVFDKSISDSMEALLAVCLLNMKAPLIARLLYLFNISIEPNPLNSLAPSSASGREMYLSWVPLLLSASHRIIDPSLADDAVTEKRQKELTAMLQANFSALSLSDDHASTPSTMLTMDLEQDLENRSLALEPLQKIIGYRFRRIRILLQAITHPSSFLSFRWGCYQR